MHTIQNSYRGLGLLMTLNWDRAIFIAAILVGLTVGAWVGNL